MCHRNVCWKGSPFCWDGFLILYYGISISGFARKIAEPPLEPITQFSIIILIRYTIYSDPEGREIWNGTGYSKNMTIWFMSAI